MDLVGNFPHAPQTPLDTPHIYPFSTPEFPVTLGKMQVLLELLLEESCSQTLFDFGGQPLSTSYPAFASPRMASPPPAPQLLGF